ncbi:proteasome subunit alpha type-6-like isoform X1 [Hibiscus syriacus]|uniref:Proteasome subunit alpha type-6-like isoform X1 n=1 Tax=Hibiscus syriacus TaxID=106335 RepID=A0A6A2XWH8_HIBSY|nr:proteasome subunit alpha type-6-like isoform X1 [Hibiscus syriacus]
MALIKHRWVLVLVIVIAFVLQIIFFSPISPEILQLPLPSSTVSVPPSNSQLQKVTNLGEGLLIGPVDVAVDEKGTLYTATRDGWIRKLHPKGLLKFTDDGVRVLASHVHGSEIRFADDVIEASDGSIYFSVASTKFELHNWHLDLLEAKPFGQLLKYDPSTEQTSILLDGLYFANGVALSKDEDFLIVCETMRKDEIFIKNLLGGPDNINLAPDGSFWIALLQLVPEETELVHTSRALKRVILNFPKLIELVVGGEKRKAKVINVAADCDMLKRFDDPNGTVITFVTSAVEFEDHLYLGSLNTNFVGNLPLK